MFSFADDDTLNNVQHENYRTISYNRDFTNRYKDYDTQDPADKHDTPDAYKTPSGIGPFDGADPYRSKNDEAAVQDDDDTDIADWDRFEAIRFTDIPSAGAHSSSVLYLRPWDHLAESSARVTVTLAEGTVWQEYTQDFYFNDQGQLVSSYGDARINANSRNWRTLTDEDEDTDGIQVSFDLAKLDAGHIRDASSNNPVILTSSDIPDEGIFTVTVPSGQTWQRNVATDPGNDPADWQDQTTDTDGDADGVQLAITLADLKAGLWRNAADESTLTLAHIALRKIETNLRPEGADYDLQTGLKLSDLDDHDVEVAPGQIIDVRDIARLVLKPAAEFRTKYGSDLVLTFQVFDGTEWSEAEYRFTLNLDGLNRAPAPQTTTPAPVEVYERDEDFGVLLSDDNRDSAHTPQPLTEYALRVGHFDTVSRSDGQTRIIVVTEIDGVALDDVVQRGRLELGGATTDRFTLVQLRNHHVRLRYDADHNPDRDLDFHRTPTCISGDDAATQSHTAEVRPDHIVVLSNDHFGTIRDADDAHDPHDITITLTQSNVRTDGIVQVWDGTRWAAGGDADTSAVGVQIEFTLQQLTDGHVRFVHQGRDRRFDDDDIRLSWSVRDRGVDTMDGTEDDLVSGPYDLVIEVIPVNDRPITRDVLRTISEDGTYRFVYDDIAFADADSTADGTTDFVSVKITGITYGSENGQTLSGRLMLNDKEVQPGQSIAASQIENLVFIPDADQWNTEPFVVTTTAGQIWQRYDGHNWADLNGQEGGDIRLSLADLMNDNIQIYMRKDFADSDASVGEYLQQLDGADLTLADLSDRSQLLTLTAKNNGLIQVWSAASRLWRDLRDYDLNEENGVQVRVTAGQLLDGHVRVLSGEIIDHDDLLTGGDFENQIVSVVDGRGGAFDLNNDATGAGVNHPARIMITVTAAPSEVWQKFDLTFNRWENLADTDDSTAGAQVRFTLSALRSGRVRKLDEVSVSETLTVTTETRPDAEVSTDGTVEITLPDGVVYEEFDGTSWVAVTGDSLFVVPLPETESLRDGEVTVINVARLLNGTARFVADGTSDPIDTDAFVTIRFRVFDGTEHSSNEKEIKIHVTAVNDAPVAEDTVIDSLTAPADEVHLSGGAAASGQSAAAAASANIYDMFSVVAKTAGPGGNNIQIRLVYDDTVSGVSVGFTATLGGTNIITLTYGDAAVTVEDIRQAISAYREITTSAVVLNPLLGSLSGTITSLSGIELPAVTYTRQIRTDEPAEEVTDPAVPVTSQITAPAEISTDPIAVTPGIDSFIVLFADGRFDAVSVGELRALNTLMSGEFAVVATLNADGTVNQQANSGGTDYFNTALSTTTIGLVDGLISIIDGPRADLSLQAARSILQANLAISEDGEYHFADLLSGQGDPNRLEKYEAFFGFDDADKGTQGNVETWSLVSIRFTDLPSDQQGVLVLRPHDQVWYDDTIVTSDIIRKWDDNGRPSEDPSDAEFTDRQRRRDRDDGDVIVAVGDIIALADLDRLVFIPAENQHGTFTLKFQVYDGQDWSGSEDGTGSKSLQITVRPVADAPAPDGVTPQVLYERDEDFGVSLSDDNRDGAHTPQPLTEYALRLDHFAGLTTEMADSTIIYFDFTHLVETNGRVEIFDPDTREWGLPVLNYILPVGRFPGFDIQTTPQSTVIYFDAAAVDANSRIEVFNTVTNQWGRRPQPVSSPMVSWSLAGCVCAMTSHLILMRCSALNICCPGADRRYL